MQRATDISAFRDRLAASAPHEPKDPAPILAWLETCREQIAFSTELIPLNSAQGWQADRQSGDIIHESGAFFTVQAVRTEARGLREVAAWDQPIFTQKEGGILAMICRQNGDALEFLLQAKAEPGNIGALQLAPSAQCTWSNLKQAHKGKRPPFADILLGETPAELVYAAEHNEEGGRFWRKSNSNRLYLVDALELPSQSGMFIWASLSQIKALALIDNVLSPFVKTIIAPL